jgi:hypothetical protein
MGAYTSRSHFLACSYRGPVAELGFRSRAATQYEPSAANNAPARLDLRDRAMKKRKVYR